VGERVDDGGVLPLPGKKRKRYLLRTCRGTDEGMAAEGASRGPGGQARALRRTRRNRIASRVGH
jgi:hypothetical protein